MCLVQIYLLFIGRWVSDYDWVVSYKTGKAVICLDQIELVWISKWAMNELPVFKIGIG